MVALSSENESLPELLAREDAAQLQGDWCYLAGNRVADVNFTGDQFTIRFNNGEVFRGTFTLNPQHRPKAIDLHIQEGPRHSGKVSLGLYQIDGKYMVICPGIPGTGERPPFFPPGNDRERLSITFKRAAKT
jgi:uncharacterized protein (TIGR03067 family)